MTKVELSEKTLNGSRKGLYTRLRGSKTGDTIAIADESLQLVD